MKPAYIGHFAKTLRKRRIELGMTQHDLAAKMHMHEQSIWRYEHGTRYPNRHIIRTIASHLKMKPTDLYDPVFSDRKE